MEKKSRHPKIIAYYLPQYHEIPENNEWWGKGFTEWTNVKRAKPFYKGQEQPRIPLNNNYYNLMDKKTIEWQTDLAERYGIYGFCYFHYYFKNGRKILEKPAENLLKWKDINQKFCFFWANVEWRRTWSANQSNHVTTWAPNDNLKNDDSLLLEQDYGNETVWREHFNYLLPFFLDDRYIRIDNKPVFAIYYISYIPNASKMFELWNQLARENGLEGIYILSVDENCSDNQFINGILHYGNGQVNTSLGFRLWNKKKSFQKKLIKIIGSNRKTNMIMSYKKYWSYILKDKPYGNIQNYPGGTVRYDETPRRGEDSFCLKEASPELFGKYLRKQLIRSETVFHTDYLFLDAWNEWGEGNYLEPDVSTGFQYLEAVRKALNYFDN